MAENQVIGTIYCPLCEYESDVKLNKNQKAYSYCPCNHQIHFNALDSRKVRACMARNESVKIGTIIINPLKKQEKIENERRNQLATNERADTRRDAGQCGIATNERADTRRDAGDDGLCGCF